MNSKITLFVVAHLVLFQVVQPQCINRILPITETLLPNQLLLPNIIDYPLEILPNGKIISGSPILPNGKILPSQILPNILPSQILPNILPSQIFPNVLPSQLYPNIFPNQILPSQIYPNILPNQITSNILPNQIIPNVLPNQIISGPVLPPILPGSPTTIIQDSTVANELANALQLMVVSNLLANKLPHNEVLPSPIEILPPVGPYNVY